MKSSTKLLFALVAITIVSSTVLAQAPPENRPARTEQEYNDLSRPMNFGKPSFGPKSEPRIVKKGVLAPSAQDVNDNLTFLEAPKTGLLRLLPREVYDKPEAKKVIRLKGGGAYYSFYYLAHAYGSGSDLSLEQNQLLSSFAGADIGILTELGAVDLNDLNLADQRVSFLANYRPPKNEPAARIEQNRALYGFVLSGMTYKRSLPLKVGSTYLVRSIVYNRSDLLVAFKITRQDDDGSAIILWKTLKQYKTPELN